MLIFSTPATTTAPRSLSVQVTSVKVMLEPYDPHYTNQAIPAAAVNFTVSGLPTALTAPSHLRCEIKVFNSGRQVGTMSWVTPANSSQAVLVQVNEDDFVGRPSDAHVVCRVGAHSDS
jgi:hypothetical protein